MWQKRKMVIDERERNGRKEDKKKRRRNKIKRDWNGFL